MRRITEIIVHCSATAEGKHFTAADIRRWHKGQGWADIGYHYVVLLDGTVQAGRPLEQAGAHCVGHNAKSIGVCYIGGLAADGRTPKDTRTTAQKAALARLLVKLQEQFPGASIHGHNEFAAKACPSFDVQKEYGGGRLRSQLSKWGDAATYLLAFGLVLASVIALCAGCTGSRSATRSEQGFREVVREVVRHDTIHHFALRTDSFLARDSFFLRSEARGCTLVVDRTDIRWRDRVRTVHDTVRVGYVSSGTAREAVARDVREEVKEEKESGLMALLKGVAFWLASAFAILVVYSIGAGIVKMIKYWNTPNGV